MNLRRRLSSRSSNTVYTLDFAEKLKLLEITKKSTEEMVGELKNFIKGLNEDNSANRFEKPGDKCRAYGRTCTEETARVGFETMKDVFVETGRLHRLFSNEVEERCIVPMSEWLRIDYKMMKTDVDKLHDMRKVLDSASNDARRQPNNLVMQQKHSEAEGAHKEQMIVVEEQVFKRLDDDLERLARIWKRFTEMEANLYRDVRNCIQASLDKIGT